MRCQASGGPRGACAYGGRYPLAQDAAALPTRSHQPVAAGTGRRLEYRRHRYRYRCQCSWAMTIKTIKLKIRTSESIDQPRFVMPHRFCCCPPAGADQLTVRPIAKKAGTEHWLADSHSSRRRHGHRHWRERSPAGWRSASPIRFLAKWLSGVASAPAALPCGSGIRSFRRRPSPASGFCCRRRSATNPRRRPCRRRAARPRCPGRA